MKRPVLAAVLAAVVCALLTASPGCDRNLEPYDPDVEPATPDLSRIFPESEEIEARSADGGVAPPAAPGAVAAPAGSAPIRGTVRVDQGLDVPPGAVLFVMARPAGARGGPPLAVRRIADPTFPTSFEIGPDDVMIPSLRFEGAVELSARLDSDGNATTRLPGDLQGAVASPLEPGADGVEIVLDQSL